MSYCRWSSVIPELTPKVDLRESTMVRMFEESGNMDKWHKHLQDNNVVTSDAYVYESHVGGFFMCHWTDGDNHTTDTAHEMAEYLQEQKDNGALVPQFAIKALLEEDENKIPVIGFLKSS